MYFVNQIHLDLRNKNSFKHDEWDHNHSGEYVDLNDMENSMLQQFYYKHELPALHYWGDGFCQGDANFEELQILADKGLITLEGDEDEFEADFTALDKLFIYPFKDAAEKAIEEAKENNTFYV